MEMNTRLQVEHPVTEGVTGLDLVEWQFRIAAGEPLPLKQDQVRLDGHAVEARLYAEDPERGFLPSTGKIIALRFPDMEGLRVDSGVAEGDTVTPFYDPMIAKVIAHGATRDAALDRLADALETSVVAGPRSNAGFLAALARADAFRGGAFDTGFIDAHIAELTVASGLDLAAVASGARALLEREDARIGAAQARDADAPPSPWDATDGFQLSGTRRVALPVVADGESLVAEASYGPHGVTVSVEGEAPAEDAAAMSAADAVYVLRRGRQTRVSLRDLALDQGGDAGQGGVVRAPMHGKVLAILVEPGDAVTRGERVAIIEAMKMEHSLTAPMDGVVAEITASADAQVAEGARIMTIAPAAAA
jgi:3-methylcrotonyl-CoA carboxylase alpha subunit